MERIIKAMEDKYLSPSLDLLEAVFTVQDGPEDGQLARRIVEGYRAGENYLPEMEIIMVNENDEVIGYGVTTSGLSYGKRTCVGSLRQYQRNSGIYLKIVLTMQSTTDRITQNEGRKALL